MNRPEEPGTGRERLVWKIAIGGALLFLVPMALGFAAAHFDRGSGGDYWHDRLIWIVPVLLLAATAVLAYRIRPAGVGEGERREARGRRTFWALMGAGAILGAVTAAGLIQADTLRGGELSPALALFLAAAFVIVGCVGSVFFYRRVDELEMQDNLWGYAVGASALLLIYPPWILLWLAKLVPEPSHFALFGILVGVTTLTYLVRKARR